MVTIVMHFLKLNFNTNQPAKQKYVLLIMQFTICDGISELQSLYSISRSMKFKVGETYRNVAKHRMPKNFNSTLILLVWYWFRFTVLGILYM